MIFVHEVGTVKFPRAAVSLGAAHSYVAGDDCSMPAPDPEVVMGLGIVMADIERAGGHVAIVGVLLGLAAAGALAYGLIRVVARGRAGRTRTPSRPGTADDSEPAPSRRPAEGARDPDA
jgi:hypothetical protein